MGTTKRQLSFYAESDVDLYLKLLSSGSKTRTVNEAIRQVMTAEAKVSLSDGERPTYFNDLPEEKQRSIEERLARKDRKLQGVDDEAWHAIQEAPSRNWRANVSRYLALHEAKFGLPFRLTDQDSQPKPERPLKLVGDDNTKQTCIVIVTVSLENGSKFTRGKKKAKESIEQFCLSGAGVKKIKDSQWEVTFSYKNDGDLDRQVQSLLQEISFQGDLSNCVVEVAAYEKGGKRRW